MRWWFMVLKGGSFESCKFVLGAQTRSQNISQSQMCTPFCLNWPHHHFELHLDVFWAWAFEVHEEAQRDANFGVSMKFLCSQNKNVLLLHTSNSIVRLTILHTTLIKVKLLSSICHLWNLGCWNQFVLFSYKWFFFWVCPTFTCCSLLISTTLAKTRGIISESDWITD